MGNNKSNPDKINEGEEDEMIIFGYKKSLVKTVFLYLGLILSGGTLLLLLTWKPSIYLKLTHSHCPLEKADKVLLKTVHNEEYVETVVKPDETNSLLSQDSYFYNKKIKYIWKNDISQFCRISGLPNILKSLNGINCDSFYEMAEGLNNVDALYRLQLFGENSILVEVKPIYKLILNEIRGPFYVYQMFIVIVWLIQLYYQFAVCIVLLSVISVSATVWETRKQSKALRDAVQSQSIITLLRDGKEVCKSSHELVPGDVIILPQNSITMECDAILIGGSCVVNESMLTGESIPITKVPIPNDPAQEYSSIAHKRSTLFCGTEILQSRSYGDQPVKAIVYRTGFTTSKGELIRAILFPKSVDFKLYRDLFKSMMILLIFGIPATVYTAVVWTMLQANVKDIVIIVLDVFTFLIPPALPAVMTSVNAHAQRRLRKQSIFCLNSRYINFSGALDVVCFDKTGTLTEEGLNLSGIISVENGNFQPAMTENFHLTISPLILGMATCHSLTLLNGNLLGYTLDVKMFESIGWELEEPELGILTKFEKSPPRIVYPKVCNDSESSPYIAVVRQFPFESLLQRMSVITREVKSDHFDVYIKGAPEMISSLCIQDTVPENFKDVLECYTRQGFRVLGVGSKSLNSSLSWDEIMNIPRENLECEFNFQGLLILQNPLKPQSLPAIMTLRNANIRTVMVTGDNLLTATTVSRECGMIDELDSVIILEGKLEKNDNKLKIYYSYAKLPGFSEKLNVGQNGMIEERYIPFLNEGKYHLAMEGATFNLIRDHDEQLLQKIVQKGTIFARMLPEQKLQLIEVLQKIDHQVGMCGDGANDCGALKAAHAGVSLSVAEASVASPFTSRIQNIQCIPLLIREGRCTLTSTFGACRYMICYCFVLLSAVLMMFWDGQKPSEGAYVMIDIVMNLLPPILFGGTEPFSGIVKRPPIKTMLSFLPQFSIISFIIIQIGVHVFGYYYCLSQPWYEMYHYNRTITHYPEPSHSGTTIISINTMSYVIAAVIFASGPPYRKPFYTNKIYLSVVILEFALATYLIIYPDEFTSKYMNFKRAPFLHYHLVIYAICLGNFIICYIWEIYFVQGFLFEHVVPALRKMKGAIHLYEKIDDDISKNTNWPPVGKYETIPLKTDANQFPSIDDDDGDNEIIRRSSKSFQKRWSRHSSDIRNSLIMGFRSSTSDFKDRKSESMTFVTFQDNYKHIIQHDDDKRTIPAQDSFV